MLEISKADAQLVRIFSLRQTEFRSDRLDLIPLTVSQKQIIVIQQRFHRHLKKPRDPFYMFRRVEIFPGFLKVNIRASVNPGTVSYVSLPQAFLISQPAELVRRFGDFREVRELQIELFCVLKFVR